MDILYIIYLKFIIFTVDVNMIMFFTMIRNNKVIYDIEFTKHDEFSPKIMIIIYFFFASYFASSFVFIKYM